MRNHPIVLCALAAFALFGRPASAAGEEFAGPFPSWADVRRDYGAVGAIVALHVRPAGEWPGEFLLGRSG